MPRPATTKVSRDNQSLSVREAVVLGVKKGWTVKETAFETNWNKNSLQSYAARMLLSFAYGGKGHKPKFIPKDSSAISPNIKLVYKESRFTKK
jgi:hypothetical protein